MISLDPQQQAARSWFESLRDRICAAFEAIEREAGSDAHFTYTPWDREAEGIAPGAGGGGVRDASSNPRARSSVAMASRTFRSTLPITTTMTRAPSRCAVAARVAIPMQPGFRSLNVAVAAGIALAEALRQTKGFSA